MSVRWTRKIQQVAGGWRSRGRVCHPAATVRSSVVALAALAGLAAAAPLGAGCGSGAVQLEVRVDGLTAPDDIDGFCLAIGDQDPGGGEFARRYVLGERGVGSLPQTLTVDSGGASSAFAWVRGYREGLEVARDSAEVSFSDQKVGLTMARCPGGPGGSPHQVANKGLPDSSLAVLSLGRTGSEVVVVGAGAAGILSARGGQIEDDGLAVPEVGAAGPLDLVAFDADGDCDDDVLVVPGDGPPVLWRREADGSFTAVDGALDGAGQEAAAAAADVDGDGDVDLAVGGASDLVVWINDGTGRFARAATPVSGDGGNDVVRLGFGDFNGDGAVDLAAGRGGDAAAPSRVLFNDGAGAFETEQAVLPEVPFQVRALAVHDFNGDGFADLVLAGVGMPVKLYINRTDGRLEDRGYLPSTDPVDAASVAAADWDGDCAADLVVGLTGGGAPLSLVGTGDGKLVEDGAPGVEGQTAILGDVDDDGDADLLMVDGGADLGWAAR